MAVESVSHPGDDSRARRARANGTRARHVHQGDSRPAILEVETDGFGSTERPARGHPGHSGAGHGAGARRVRTRLHRRPSGIVCRNRAADLGSGRSGIPGAPELGPVAGRARVGGVHGGGRCRRYSHGIRGQLRLRVAGRRHSGGVRRVTGDHAGALLPASRARLGERGPRVRPPPLRDRVHRRRGRGSGVAGGDGNPGDAPGLRDTG